MAAITSDPVQPVDLTISCKNLRNLDALSKSDPQVIVYLDGREIGRTEMINDNLNPRFVKQIRIDYHFEAIQKLRFLVVDIDEPNGPLEKQDVIGELECKVSDIVTAREGVFNGELRHSSSTKRGFITVQAEEVKEHREEFRLRFSGIHLDKKDLFGKSDPYLEISRSDGNSWTLLYKTETIMKTLDPVWKPFTIPVPKLNRGDPERPLRFQCFDWNKSGNMDLIGEFTTTTAELMDGKRQFELILPRKQKKKSYKNSGIIQLKEFEVIKTHSFLEYITGGCEISLIVAIDFTASNKDPRDPNSLHFMGPHNEYMRAISSVGSILADYDEDGNFPVYGFGAQLPPRGDVSHCFPLNGNPSNPEVRGVDGILGAYQSALANVVLYGPTKFSEIIRTSAEISRIQNSQDSQKYFILLIITDGIINDMQQTMDEIVLAANLPLSIIIVGVGNADFAAMDQLDGDEVPIRSTNGTLVSRDIVQFVPMRKFIHDTNPAALSRETLAEVPKQLELYMRQHGVKPFPPSHRQSQARIYHNAMATTAVVPPPTYDQSNSQFSGQNPEQNSGQFSGQNPASFPLTQPPSDQNHQQHDDGKPSKLVYGDFSAHV
eukprot:TRINITY_DN3051_c0_g1_i1.p1 TRINITY_DN3051_c0_g1~~TRINITY_DN3051_c0_g1_i1.p1  ORF type:complete len:604 (+),score=195.97 TRINITY_DN3051_c0_g1_i1:84-1895(+)